MSHTTEQLLAMADDELAGLMGEDGLERRDMEEDVEERGDEMCGDRFE